MMGTRRALGLALALAGVGLVPALTARAAAPAPQFRYVRMDDGVEIAIRVTFPADYVAGTKYPAMLTMDGYAGAGGPVDNTFDSHDGYVLIAGSLRGTGCSGGQLDLFSDRSSRDGAE